ncbi:hypothetical protein BGX30_003642 [Mortierella sp. GBA39]|nr:hypothetical protein BGX30_003642 [Mortierella sp. GBA39]
MSPSVEPEVYDLSSSNGVIALFHTIDAPDEIPRFEGRRAWSFDTWGGICDRKRRQGSPGTALLYLLDFPLPEEFQPRYASSSTLSASPIPDGLEELLVPRLDETIDPWTNDPRSLLGYEHLGYDDRYVSLNTRLIVKLFEDRPAKHEARAADCIANMWQSPSPTPTVEGYLNFISEMYPSAPQSGVARSWNKMEKYVSAELREQKYHTTRHPAVDMKNLDKKDKPNPRYTRKAWKDDIEKLQDIFVQRRGIKTEIQKEIGRVLKAKTKKTIETDEDLREMGPQRLVIPSAGGGRLRHQHRQHGVVAHTNEHRYVPLVSNPWSWLVQLELRMDKPNKLAAFMEQLYAETGTVHGS